MSQKYTIIVAGGKGERMQTELPKQFIPIAKKPLLMHTISKFYAYDASMHLILVLPANQVDYWQVLCQKHNFHIPHQIVTGGETRFHSVSNGLSTISGSGLVAIHDGVRPFVSIDTITRCFEMAAEKGAAIPSIEIVDSIRYFDKNENKSVDRNSYCLIQTPQVFQVDLIKKGFKQVYSPSFTDDASVVEAMGEKVYLVDGNRENIKITTPYDLELANSFLSKLTL